MLRALLVALIVTTTALSGCLWWGDDDEDGEPGPSPSPSPGPSDDNGTGAELIVVLDNITDAVTEGTPLTVQWSAELASDGIIDPAPAPSPPLPPQNRTIETYNLTETGLVWSSEPVEDPNGTDDYENVEAAFQNVEAPGTWNTTITLEPENATAGNGTSFHVRAYAIHENGTVVWSDEVTVQVLFMDPVEINIGNGTVDGPFAAYDPQEITIQAGQRIVWHNLDKLDMAHTATSTDGPASFDTGEIQAGERSTAIILDVPGTYTYRCSVHPTTMPEGTIVVEAA